MVELMGIGVAEVVVQLSLALTDAPSVAAMATTMATMGRNVRTRARTRARARAGAQARRGVETCARRSATEAEGAHREEPREQRLCGRAARADERRELLAAEPALAGDELRERGGGA